MFRKKKSIFAKIIFNQYVLVLFILGLLFLISIPLARNISKKYKIDTEVRALEDEIIGLQKKNLELEKLINNYSETDFVEEIARLNLGLKKEGEEVLVVKKTGENLLEGDYESLNNSEIKFAGDSEESNPRKWLRYFLKK